MDDSPSAQSSALSRTVRRWRDISAGAGPYPDVSAAAEDVVELLSQLARLRRTTHHVSRRDPGRRPGGAS